MLGVAASLATGACAKKESPAPVAATQPTPADGGKIPVTTASADAKAEFLQGRDLAEKLVGTIHQNNFKPELDRQWAYLCYAGLWMEPLMGDLNAFMDSVNVQVTGNIQIDFGNFGD